MMRHALPAALLLAAPFLAATAQRPATRPAPSATRDTQPIAVAGERAAHAWPTDSSWRHIGPASFGGRIDDVEAVESDPRVVFVGTASGGIFRSVNAGVTWEPVFDKYGTALSIGDIAIAPSDPNVVWAGTGEPNGRQSSTWGDGVYRSLDGGTTWRHMGLRETQNVGRVRIHPTNPDIVFVAALGHLWGPNEERGLYRTTDAGKTWKKVLGVDDNTGVVDVALDADGRTVYAATYQRRRRAWGFVGGGPGSALWRSLDGGDTWEKLTKGLPTGDVGRIGIDISRSDPNIVYAIIENRASGGVYRSDDRGATWRRQNALDPRPSYYSQIRVDPKHPDHVWVLGTPLFESIDGGKTFSSDSTGEKIHVDHHALWIDPARPEHMMLGNDGGLYFTYDGARHWNFIDNLPIGQFYDIAIDGRDPYWIYGGAQDNGTWGVPSRTYAKVGITNADVVNVAFGDGFQVAVDPRDPKVIYANSQSGRAYLFDLETHEERGITPVSADPKERYRFNWNTAILLSPRDPDVYYFGAQVLFRTNDRGTTWKAISPDLTKHLDWKKLPMGAGFAARDQHTLSRDDGVGDYGTITTISESPLAAGTLLVGTDDGNVQMTTDGGSRWTDITPRFALPGARWVSRVLLSRHDARTAYATFDGHNDDDMRPYVFRSTDGGATWSSIAGDLPMGVPVKTLEEDPRNPSLLFAGTEFGLYFTRDGGRHWQLAGGNVPRVIVDRVLVNERTNDLILGTHGRSIIVLDDISPLQQRDPAATNAEVELFAPRDATEIYEWRILPTPGAGEFAAPNPPVGTFITYWLRDDPPAASAKDSARTVTIRVKSGDGSVVQEMKGPDARGMHRVVWDLRHQFAVAPPEDEGGWFGTLRAPYVLPGQYTIELVARGRTLTRTVNVRADPRVRTTTEALRARRDAGMRIGELHRAFTDGARAFERLDAELGRIRTALRERGSTPAADSAVRTVAVQLDSLRSKFGRGFGSPSGRMFDLLGALEASSLAPTEAQMRTLEHATAEVRANIAALNDLITRGMPALRARLGELAPTSEQPVKPPA